MKNESSVGYMIHLIELRDMARAANCPKEWLLHLNAAILDQSVAVLRAVWHHRVAVPQNAPQRAAMAHTAPSSSPTHPSKFAQRSNQLTN